jgi:hypothetical protein
MADQTTTPSAPNPAVTAARVREMLDLADEAMRHGTELKNGGAAAADPAAMLVLGQRVLLKLIPFVEPLARDGPSRRAVLVALVDEGERMADNAQLRLALGAVKQGLALNVDRILVAALQDTEMLARSARGCGACLLSMFQNHFRQHARPAAPAAPSPGPTQV